MEESGLRRVLWGQGLDVGGDPLSMPLSLLLYPMHLSHFEIFVWVLPQMKATLAKIEIGTGFAFVPNTNNRQATAPIAFYSRVDCPIIRAHF